jgi:hypothetical protein
MRLPRSEEEENERGKLAYSLADIIVLLSVDL